MTKLKTQIATKLNSLNCDKIHKLELNRGQNGSNPGLFKKFNICQESCKPSIQMNIDEKNYEKVLRKF